MGEVGNPYYRSIPCFSYISIAEVVGGVVGFIRSITVLIGDPGSHSYGIIILIIVDILLLATGAFGVFTVRQVRRGGLVKRPFTVLTILNIILCILFTLLLILSVCAATLLAVDTRRTYLSYPWYVTPEERQFTTETVNMPVTSSTTLRRVEWLDAVTPTTPMSATEPSGAGYTHVILTLPSLVYRGRPTGSLAGVIPVLLIHFLYVILTAFGARICKKNTASPSSRRLSEV
ncbi:uncharacterized protein LOC129588437 [Paramacrobiotus metropolitanus]|uniref:uncharacterized protein LOC129588437 n=1 Tax=Paramacrobiotus metropolitanus TaxID=2943436 RepID=UPI00244615B5|nr:uncharacterized protein LOC129588437 [Paramacrobiotus metropolitanus]